MAEFREDTTVYPVMVQLSACLCTEIQASGLPNPCFCGVLPGSSVVLDFCGDGKCGGTCGGQAWVRPVDMYPSAQFPVADVNPTNCNSPLAFRLEVGIARCMPMGTNSAVGGYTPPTLEQQLDAARLQMADMAAIRRAIQCCMAANDNLDYVLESYTPLIPQGGCGGGAFTVVIRNL
jgi:hypothetical protein